MDVKLVSYRDPNAARKFAQSFRETGFAVLTDHPVSKSLIQDTYGEWEDFFKSEDKFAMRFDPQLQAGYFPFRSENAKDSSVKDLKEFFHYYPERGALPPQAKRHTTELYASLVNLGDELLRWVESETPAEIRAKLPMPLSQMTGGSEETLLRILHYPPLTGGEEASAVRAAAHEDINLITLLPAATAPGLEVKDMQGRWHAVACDPGMIVVNSGDMLQEATGGYFPSTTHRVVNPNGPEAGKSRYSMPLFLHPRREAPLTATRTAGAYLRERLVEIGLAPKA